MKLCPDTFNTAKTTRLLIGYSKHSSRLRCWKAKYPSGEINYKGVVLKEFDIDAVLERKPQLVLIDRLAHTNAAGSRHMKRYQDVSEIQCRNRRIQYGKCPAFESLHDLVASITGFP